MWIPSLGQDFQQFIIGQEIKPVKTKWDKVALGCQINKSVFESKLYNYYIQPDHSNNWQPFESIPQEV